MTRPQHSSPPASVLVSPFLACAQSLRAYRLLSALFCPLTLLLLICGSVLPAEAQYTWTNLAGQQGGPGNVDGTGIFARFDTPYGTAVDSSGNVYVADTGRHTIRKVTSSGVVTTLAGTAGSSGTTDGTGSAARFSSPTGVAVDSSGNVYVADYGNNTVRKITSGGVVTTLAGSAGMFGSTDATGSAARFRNPINLAVDSSGNVYVSDFNNGTIRQITSGGVVTTLAGLALSTGSADGTGSAARFNFPRGVAVDSSGNVYVADTSNYTIRKITSGGVVTTLAGTAGSAGSADGTGSAALFNSPTDVAVDSSGNVYVADQSNHTIRQITSGGVVTTLAGTAGIQGSTDGTGSAARFNTPTGLALDGSGNLFVADTYNYTIRKIASGAVVTTLAGSALSTGSADGTGNAARFNFPTGVAVDGSGSVYVADTNNHTIRKITSGGVVTTLAGTAGSQGSADGTGSAARFRNPTGVAVDSSGNVYVADQANHTIRQITSGGVVTTLAGTAGSQGGTDATGSAARFRNPYSVAVDGSGNVYVADTSNYTIRKITSGGVVTTLAGTAGSFGSTDGTGSAAQFNNPTGVAVDGSGNVYVVDNGNHLIRKISSGAVVTSIGGTAAFIGGADGVGASAQFFGPYGIAVDSSGKLSVADQSNSRITQGTPTAFPAPTVTAISPTSGSTAGGTSVTITGTDFTGATAVTIGGTAATTFTVDSATQITATTPAGTTGTASVLVTTPGGTNAANTLFTYNNAPTGITHSSASPSNSGLIAYWPFDSQATLGLDSHNNNQLTINGGAQSGTGKLGTGLSLNGSNQYLSGTVTNLPIGSSHYTQAAWIRPTAGGARGIIGWGAYGASNQVNAFRLDGGASLFNYWWGNDLFAGAVGSWSSGNWYHVVATYNGTNRRIYVNGVQVAQDTPGTPNVTAANFAIGVTNSFTEFFQGTLDEVRIYNRALSGTEVASLHTAAPLAIAENNAANATVGTLTAQDDAGDTHTFSLVSGTGDADNASFSLSTAGVLTIGILTDYETKSSYSIRVRVEDAGGLSAEQALTVSVTNVNEAVLSLALTGSTVAENVALNSSVGTFSSTDTDAGDTHSYTLVAGTGDTNNANFNISGNALRANAGIDFEAGATRSIRVRSTDAGGLSVEDVFTITVTNKNEVPVFTKGADQRHPYLTSGANSVAAWATGMDDGDSTVVQSLAFTVNNNNNGLFSAQPAVNATTGNLSYTLNGTSGVATVSVSLTDDTSINGDAALTSAVQTFTITVDPAPDYTVVTSTNSVTLTNTSDTSDTLSFSNGGSSASFAAAGRTFSLDGGVNQTGSISVDYASYPNINSVVINAAGGNDVVNIGDFSALPGFAGITINGGTGDDTVNFNGDVAFGTDLGLDVDLQNDHATPGVDSVNVAANANLVTSGTGTIVVRASRSIALASGSSLETANGDLTVEANQQAIPTTGNFLGIHSDGGQIAASGTGVVTVKGRGGDASDHLHGVYLENAASITGGTTGSLVVEGTGGACLGDFNVGVNVRASSITSTGANTVVNGTGGGTGASSGNWGVNVENLGTITAGGSGTVFVGGLGGNGAGSGNNNYGVQVRFLSSVTSSGGNVTVQGTGAASSGDFNIGVNVSSGSITSSSGNVSVAGTGAGSGVSADNWGVNIEVSGEVTAGVGGTVSIVGIGGNIAGTGGSNHGVQLRLSGVATSSGGALSVTGTGGGSTGAGDNLGVNVLDSSSITTATNGGTNTIMADSMGFQGTSLISAGPMSSVTLRPLTNGTAIDLGAVDSAGVLGLTDAELNRVTAGTLDIGSGTAGNITISAPISPAGTGTLNLISGGTIADTNTSGTDITVAGLTTNGILAPGTSPGIFSVAGNHSLVSGSSFNVELGGLTAGTQHDQLNVAGTVTIGANVTLNVSTISGFIPDPGNEFVLVSNDGTDAVTGTFNGLADGATIILGSISTVLTYTGGDGNDIVLRRPAIIPVFLGASGSTGGGSGSGSIDAPNADATASLGKWETIRQGAVLSSNGHIAFRGHMELGTGIPPVTASDFQGIWRYDGTDTRLKARSGSTAPDTSNALFDLLPLNPAISPSGLTSFYGALRLGTGSPAVTASTNFGLWSEIGGGAVRLLLRKGDTIVPGKTFRSGFAVTASDVNTAALNAKLSSGTALLHLDVNTPTVQLTVVAEEGQSAPGGGTWVALDGNSSDPRLSANGDLGFIGWERVGNAQVQGIYSRLNTTVVGTSGATKQARVGEPASGTSGATFSAFERPTVFNGGMAFRGFLNRNGDNATGNKGQGVWAGAFGALAPVVRTGDTDAQIPTIPAGGTVSSVWSPFSNALGSITMRISIVNGGETRAIVGSTGGTMRVIAKVSDAAPGLAGETFTNFDHPVIGNGDQVAFTASTNAGNYGIWKEAPGGGALSLIMKVGDTISTSEGDKVVSQISLPGTTTDDRKYEARCMDATGRLLIHVTFVDGTTSLLLGQ